MLTAEDTGFCSDLGHMKSRAGLTDGRARRSFWRAPEPFYVRIAAASSAETADADEVPDIGKLLKRREKRIAYRGQEQLTTKEPRPGSPKQYRRRADG
jgi:hypothetical protein